MRRCVCIMMASSNENIFRVTGHLCREFTGIHWSPVISSHKGRWCGALMFSLICAWINGHFSVNGTTVPVPYHVFALYTAWSWWRHQIETFSALLAICAGNSPVTGEFPTQRPVTRSFDVFFDLRLNKRLSKQSWGWWFEALSRPLWRHCSDWGSDTHCATSCYRSSLGWR